MAIDYEKVNNYLSFVKTVEVGLEQHQELFDSEKLIEFKQITSSLEYNIELAKNASRKLSIGIVGAVKAGKSSFLNACIFAGNNYLPKAATPMTAALTRISYSETPKAIIHFYTSEDWENIERNSLLHDEELKKAYDEYCDKIYEKNAQASYVGMVSNKIEAMSQIEYEKKYKCKSEVKRGAKELTRMIKDPTLLDKLGTSDEIYGDVINKLNDYVGANGHYTPIVSYVELKVDNPYIKDLEIVDTPGLNDPIISRGIKTNQFLRSCDVVLLLSPCSQFMDYNTVTLMASSLPNAGVREVIIVGSKLDSGILNENSCDFEFAYKKSLNSYKSQFNKNITLARNTGKHLDILDKMTAEKILFISSTCFAIARKMRENISLDEHEKKTFDNLHNNFTNFEDKYFVSLGGINKVKAALNAVLSRKIEIIEGKNTDLLDNARINHLRILEKILQETVSSRTKLETISAEELKHRSSNIRDIIDSSRERLIHIFDLAIIKCDDKVQQILPQLTVEMGQHQKIAVKTDSHEDHTTERVGLFGWQKEIVYFTVVDNIADTSSVIENIKMYSAKCQTFINGEFKNIFNKDEFVQNIKNIVLNAFNKSQKEFDEEDVLLPIQKILDKISIPHIVFDCTLYIDEIQTRFKSGYAKNDEIHQLRNLQIKLMNKIEVEISTQLVNVLKEITKTLNAQALVFADQIEAEFCSELEKLQGQVEQRERYIEEYHKFTQIVRDMKTNMS